MTTMRKTHNLLRRMAEPQKETGVIKAKAKFLSRRILTLASPAAVRLPTSSTPIK